MRRSFRPFAFAALLLAALAAPVLAAEFYVAPNASGSGNGSFANPWKLQTALNHPAAVNAGDTIWLRGGTYTGYFTSYLAGTSSNPIIVRQYPGERAILDGNHAGTEFTLEIRGSYTWYWGFEIFNSDPTRYTSDGNDPPRRGEGVHLLGDGTKMINLIVHDTSQGVISGSSADGTEIYGNLLYYNGFDSPDRGHGHGAYVANYPGNAVKKIYDNIIFQQFGYGIHGYTEGGDLDNLDYQGNTVFDNGGLSGSWYTNILLGGLQAAANPKLTSNYTYNQDHASTNNLGYSAGCSSPSITNNYLTSGEALDINSCSSLTITGNTFYGSISGFSQSAFPGNTYYGSTRPTGVKVFIRPNVYEAGRANITIYNWDLTSTVPVDLSSVLAPGASYVLVNAQNPFAAPVLSGTYDGTPVSVPMTGLTPALPIGVSAPAATGPEFNVFILTSTPGPYEFFDVSQANIFHDAIHTLASNGITAGCGNGNYCPNDSVTRAQMAVFLLKSKHGASYAPPAASGSVFDDVPASAFAAAWIEQVSAEGISSGCGGGNYCPDASITRAQMAVFLLKALLGSGYTPPPATGAVFSDVPSSAFAAAWIEDLAYRGITSGCGAGMYCPSNPNTRGQMAVFLVTTFSLQ